MVPNFEQLVSRHRACFLSGKTQPAEWRGQQLAAVQAMVTERAGEFYDALWKDLRRNRVDAAVADLNAIADEAAYARRHVRRWMKPAEWREQQLAAVKAMVTERAGEFYDALWKDLRRNRVDAAVADLNA